MKAFLMTLFWGGPCGQRPAFTVTASGEATPTEGGAWARPRSSSCAQSWSRGTLAIRTNLSVDRVMARNKRVALFDNLKAFRFSSDVFESLVTCKDINEHRLNHGHTSRPNYLTFAVTVNGRATARTWPSGPLSSN